MIFDSFQPRQLKVMMQRRHAKNAFAARFERADLEDNRKRLHHKDSPDKGQQQFLLDQHRDSAQRTAQRERPTSPIKISAG